jgi:hypothetical protein
MTCGRSAGGSHRLRGDLRQARSAAAVSASRSGVPGLTKASRQVQAHHLHQHLVAVGGAVEGAGAGAVVARRRLGLEQFVAAGLALGIGCWRTRPSRRSAGPRSSARPARRSPAGGRRQRADQQAGHDLVADAEHSAPSNMSCDSATAVAIAITSRLNSDSSMPVAALGDAVAHRRHAAGHLRRRAAARAPPCGSARGSARRAGAPTACRCRRDDAEVRRSDAIVAR